MKTSAMNRREKEGRNWWKASLSTNWLMNGWMNMNEFEAKTKSSQAIGGGRREGGNEMRESKGRKKRDEGVNNVLPRPPYELQRPRPLLGVGVKRRGEKDAVVCYCATVWRYLRRVSAYACMCMCDCAYDVPLHCACEPFTHQLYVCALRAQRYYLDIIIVYIKRFIGNENETIKR